MGSLIFLLMFFHLFFLLFLFFSFLLEKLFVGKQQPQSFWAVENLVVNNN